MGDFLLRIQVFSRARRVPIRHGPGFWVLALATAVLFLPPGANAQDVPFLESPESVVEAMLDLAQVSANDLVYDLGSGDGRIVIAAAASREARGVGVEIESDLIELSIANAREAEVEDLVTFVQGDFFETDFSEATVLMLYLQPKVNKRLRPILTEQLSPGTRVVSHRYEFRDWTPAKRIKVEGRSIFLYVIP
jgi:SAM-dependent methyltransferase